MGGRKTTRFFTLPPWVSRCLCVSVVGFAGLVPKAAAHAPTPAPGLESIVLLRADGSAVVIENFAPGALRSPFIRRIPVEFDAPFGRRELLVEVVAVKDAEDNPQPYDARRSGSSLTIQPSHPEAGVKLVYLVRNAVRFTAGHDEFYWPVNPPGLVLGASTLDIYLPEAAADNFRAQAFLLPRSPQTPVAAQWSTDGGIPVRIEGSRLQVASPGPLEPGIAMVADVFVEKGILTPPGALTRAEWFANSNRIVFLPLVVLAVMLLIRKVRGSDPDPGRSVAPMYEPPEEMTPAECGVLIDDSIDPRDIASTMIDLARRGFVKIELDPPQPGKAETERDYTLRLLKPREEWTGLSPNAPKPGASGTPLSPNAPKPGASGTPLAPHEWTMLFHTFYGGHWTKLSSLRLRFPDIVPTMKSQIMDSLRERGLYRIDPEQAQSLKSIVLYWALLGIRSLPQLAVIGIVLVLQWLGGEMFSSPALGAIMLAISAAIIFLLAPKFTIKTMAGMQTYVALLGFQEFIRTANAERLQKMGPDAFERLLPYAIALGVEPTWAKAFQGIAETPPDWYTWSKESFNSGEFGHHMNLFATAITVLPLLRPRS